MCAVSKSNVLHYNEGNNRPACGKGIGCTHNLTCRPKKVTCVSCKRTAAFKEMMNG